ncbi:uncharacterized protein [Centruroides vittatus]|uniref:uncharacterized protein isoform X2 n=1 Tax=Centruroides vittatus TaxID=120091 RepID=UPI00350F9CE0
MNRFLWIMNYILYFSLLTVLIRSEASTKKAQNFKEIEIGDVTITITDISYFDEDQEEETEILFTVQNNEKLKTCELICVGKTVKSLNCESVAQAKETKTFDTFYIYFENSEETQGTVKTLLISLQSSKFNRLDIYYDQNYVVPNNVAFINDLCVVYQNFDRDYERFMLLDESEQYGRNYFDWFEKSVVVILHEGIEITVEAVPKIEFSLVTPYPKDSNEEIAAIDGLLSVLEISKNNIRIVEAKCIINVKTRENNTYLMFQVEIGTAPQWTSYGSQRNELNLKELSKNLTSVFQSGDTGKWFSNTVYFLNVENNTVSPDGFTNCPKTIKRYRRQSQYSTTLAESSTESIEVEGHKITLHPFSETSIPHNSRIDEELVPAPGVKLFDETEQKDADSELLKDTKWTATIEFYYDCYQGNLKGETKISIPNKENMILFEDIKFEKPNYNVYLKITVNKEDSPETPLTFVIGPFDVRDSKDNVEFKDEARLTFKYDGNFQQIKDDPERYKSCFINFYYGKYPKVGWKYIGSKAGSVITEAKINGEPSTLKSVIDDIKSKEKTFNVEKNKQWKVQRVDADMPQSNIIKRDTSDTATQEPNKTEDVKKEETKDDSTPTAWIAAIVINGILVLLFIGFVIYCYCKSKQRNSSIHMMEKNFDGEPDRMYSEKAANLSGNEKAALLDHSVFTVEDEKRRLEDEADRYSTPISGRNSSRDPRCTCGTLDCCCNQRDNPPYESRYGSTPYSARQFPQHEEEDKEFAFDEQRQNEVEDVWKPPSRTYSASSRNAMNDADYLPGAISPIDDVEESVRPPPTPVVNPTPIIPPKIQPKPDRKYYVYMVTDEYGSRECIGFIKIKDDNETTLRDLREKIENAEPVITEVIGKDYNFVTEDFQDITYQEGSLYAHRVYPSQGINIKLVKEEPSYNSYSDYNNLNNHNNYDNKPKKPSVRRTDSKRKPPPYVGPLGMCGSSDCDKPARIKCLDCNSIAYCSTRCMRLDGPNHKKSCYIKEENVF